MRYCFILFILVSCKFTKIEKSDYYCKEQLLLDYSQGKMLGDKYSLILTDVRSKDVYCYCEDTLINGEKYRHYMFFLRKKKNQLGSFLIKSE